MGLLHPLVNFFMTSHQGVVRKAHRTGWRGNSSTLGTSLDTLRAYVHTAKYRAAATGPGIDGMDRIPSCVQILITTGTTIAAVLFLGSNQTTQSTARHRLDLHLSLLRSSLSSLDYPLLSASLCTYIHTCYRTNLVVHVLARSAQALGEELMDTPKPVETPTLVVMWQAPFGFGRQKRPKRVLAKAL